MSHKISFLGMRELTTNEVFNKNTDYGLFLVVALDKIETDVNSEDVKYKLKVERIESIINLKKQTPVVYEKGRTPSQKLRFIVESKVGDYDNFMGWLMTRIDSLVDEYLENI